MDEPVCIRSFENRSLAEFAHSLLAERGIRATIWADDRAGWLPQPSPLFPLHHEAGVRLLVAAEDAARAVACLDEARAGSA